MWFDFCYVYKTIIIESFSCGLLFLNNIVSLSKCNVLIHIIIAQFRKVSS